MFVGRDVVVDECCAALDSTFAGRGRLLLVSGEAGIGKSTVVQTVAASRDMTDVTHAPLETGRYDPSNQLRLNHNTRRQVIRMGETRDDKGVVEGYSTYLLAGQTSELARLRLESRVWEPAARRLLGRIGDGRGALIDVDAVAAALLGGFNGLGHLGLVDADVDLGSGQHALAAAHLGLLRTHAAPSERIAR